MKIQVSEDDIEELEFTLDWVCRHQPMMYDDGTHRCVCYQPDNEGKFRCVARENKDCMFGTSWEAINRFKERIEAEKRK